jgi:hypothetical protein
MNPLLRLLATHPNLLAVHAESYARIMADEISTTSDALQRRALLGAGALFFLFISLILGGVALLLWGSSIAVHPETRWVLIVVPGVPFGLALVFFILFSSSSQQPMLSKVKTQFKADLAMLHETGVL